MDSAGEADSTFENNKATGHGNLTAFTLFRPRIDRRIHDAPGKYSNSLVTPTLYLSLSERSRGRVLVGKIVFSRITEKLLLGLILVFAAVELTTVALRDEFGSARIYILSIQLAILALFQAELLCKLVALGCVSLRQVFFRSSWNLVDCLLVAVSLVLTILDLVPGTDFMESLEASAVLRLFKLIVTARKASEFQRINHQLRKRIAEKDFTVEMASERVLDLLKGFLYEPWVQSNLPLLNELRWCIDIISSNKLYDTVLTLKKEPEQEKKAEIINLVRLFSINAHPGNSIQSQRRSSSLQRNGTSLSDLKAGLPEGVLECLGSIDTNEFDAFRLKEVTGGDELVTLMHILFARTDLCLTTNLDASRFAAFVKGVQAGYHADNPYHNATHATDVLQALHFFLGTCGVEAYLSTTPIELVAAYIAAAVHDMDHPSVNNSFLVNTQAKLAFRYNDRSVLENHHVASAFALTMQEDMDLFTHLSLDDYKRIREVIIEMVLSTDIALHFSMLNKFRAKFLLSNLKEVGSEDRVLGLSHLLHTADISNPSRPWPLCRHWTQRVMQEFWAQGDQERVRGLDVSYMMDRYSLNVAKSQIGFIDVIVSPAFEALMDLCPRFHVSYECLMNNKTRWAERVEGAVWEQDSGTLPKEESHSPASK